MYAKELGIESMVEKGIEGGGVMIDLHGEFGRDEI